MVKTRDVDIAVVEKLLTIARQEKVDLRLRALLITLHSTGGRISEVLSIKREDMVYRGGMKDSVMITGKGSKRRRLFLNEPARDIIFEYIATHCSAWVFPGRRGFEAPMSRFNAYLLLRGMAEANGIQGFHPHLMRHYFVKKLAFMGSDHRDIQKIVGHVRIADTCDYGGGAVKACKRQKNSRGFLVRYAEALGKQYLSLPCEAPA